MILAIGQAWADHPAPAGVDPQQWHQSKVNEEKFMRGQDEGHRQQQCRILSLVSQSIMERCLRNEPVPAGYADWSTYADAWEREQRQKQRLANEAENRRRDEAAAESNRRALELQAQREKQEQEARLERIRREQEIAEEQRKLNEQNRSNQRSRQNTPQAIPQPVPEQGESSTIFWAFVLLIVVFGLAISIIYGLAWYKQRQLLQLQAYRRTLIKDWGSLEEFDKQLTWLDERLHISEVQEWTPQHWQEFIRQDLRTNWHQYQELREELFKQFNRYNDRTWEPELVIAERDFGRRRDRTDQLMNLYHRQSQFRWRLLTEKERPNVRRPESLPT
jgi:flagellar biosynthesis GTPase FlhF